MKRFFGGSTPRHNFALVDYHHIDGLNMSVLYARHEPSGAHFVHLERDDPHLAHGIAFRTPPADDRGLPHILEHCVLCGSHKYPVKDPFFLMLNRSLASYMNAWTSSDHTFYPFSTENIMDFKNLRSVYLDSVFNPLLRKRDFMQEAWSFNKDAELKGVVYNEMKGSLSDPDSLFYRKWHQAFYNNTPYAFNNGGDPLAILKTSHEDLISFYQEHYCPLNSLIVSYGKLDLEEEFKFLDHTLHEVARKLKQPYPQLKMESSILQYLQNAPSFETSKVVKVPGPMGSDGIRILRSYLANNSTVDMQENFDLKILSSLLLDGPAAPLHKSLLEEHTFGKDFVTGTGYDSSSVYSSFGIGIDGIEANRIDEFKNTLNIAIHQVHSEGFSKERIEGILHQLSLDLRYQSSSFGLNMAAQLASAWTKGTDVCEALDFPARMRHFELNDPQKRLKALIQKYLIGNSKFLDFEMHPNAYYLDNLQNQEKSQISILNPKEFICSDEPVETASKDVLPIIQVEDIGESLKHPSMPSVAWPQIDKRVIRERFARTSSMCNELVYIRLLGIHDFSVPNSLLVHLPMALGVMTELGAGELRAETIDSLVKRLCGGLGVSFFFNRHHGKNDLRVELSTYSLETKLTSAVELFAKCLRECRWDERERVKLLLGQATLSSRNGIASSGHKYAALRAASLLDEPLFKAQEITGGLTQIGFLQKASSNFDDNYIVALQKTAGWALNTPKFWKSAMIRGGDAEVYGENQFDTLLNAYVSLPEKDVEPLVDLDHDISSLIEDLNSSYVAQCYLLNGPMSVHEKAAMLLFSNYLKSKVLHQLIREQGGAYGAAANFDHASQLLTLSSYRDPQPQRTLDILGQVLVDPMKYELSEEDLRESKLSIFQGWDAPKDIANQGLTKYRTDVDDLERLELRRAILRMSPTTFTECLHSSLIREPGRGTWKGSNYILKNPKHS